MAGRAARAKRREQRARRHSVNGPDAQTWTAQESEEALLAWLEGLSNQELHSAVRIGQSSLPGAGRGLFAQRSFEAGEEIFSLPPEAALVPAAGDEGSGSLPPYDALALALLRERARGAASPFAAYIALLPSKEALSDHPAMWPADPDVLDAFSGSPRALRVLGAALKQLAACLERLAAAGVDRSDAAWALAAVVSREFEIASGPDGSQQRRVALYPLLDFMNAGVSPSSSGGAAAFLEGLPVPWSCRCDIASSGGVQVQAARAISSGEELLLAYQPLSSAELLANYGFLPTGNLYEGADLVVDLAEELAPEAEALRAAKLAALRRWAGQRRPDGLVVLQLRGGVEGDGDAGGLLLPLARLLCLTSVEEVERLCPALFWMHPEGAGRPCSLGPALEALARRRVLRWARRALALAAAAADTASHGATTQTGRLALRLLEVEQPLLQREREGAEGFCRAFMGAEGPEALGELEDYLWDDETGWDGSG